MGAMPKRRPERVPEEIKKFPLRMRYARALAGEMTLSELARRTTLQVSQLSRIETGEYGSGVSFSTAVMIAQGLGQPVGWMLAGEGAPNEAPVLREPRKPLVRKAANDTKSSPAVAPAPRDVRRR